MKIIKFTLLFLLSGLFTQLSAQDIHWSLYNMSPLTLNPALTGSYLGTARIGGIYRDQAFNAEGITGYTTPSFYVDAPIVAIGKRDWIGIGGMFYADEAGSASLTNQGAYASIAYHKALDKKGNTLLSFGLQGGLLSRDIDVNELRFGDEVLNQLQTGTFTQTPENRANLAGSSAFDLNAGVMLTARLNKLTDLNIGLSFYHILSPNYALDATQTVNTPKGARDLPLAFKLHGQFNFSLGEKWLLSPTFLYNQAFASNELQVQGMVGYKLNDKDPMIIKLGPGYRLGDAVEVLLGVDYKSFRFGASYDLTVSDLSDINNGQGAFEFALSYIIKIFKAPTVKPVVICPRL